MKNLLLTATLAAEILTPPLVLHAAPSTAPSTAKSAQATPSYFSASASLKMARDERGILLVTFNTKGGPLTFTAKDHTDFVDAFYRISQDHFIQPLKERLVHEVSNGLSREGAAAADLVKSMNKTH